MWRQPKRDAASVLAYVVLFCLAVPLALSLAVRDTARGPALPAASTSALHSLAGGSDPAQYSIYDFKNAGSSAVDPRTGYLYVANNEGSGYPGDARTSIYDPRRAAVIGFIDGVSGPMVVDPARGELVVLQGDDVVFVNTTTKDVVATLSEVAPLGWRRPVLTLDAVDGLVYAAYNYRSATVIGLSSTLLVVNLAAHAVVAQIGDLVFTTGIAFDPDDGRIYAASVTGQLTVIDSRTSAVLGVLHGLDGPNGIAYNPVDGNLYIACYNGRVVNRSGSWGWEFTAGVAIVDPRTLTTTGTVSGFHAGWDGPAFVVFNPDDRNLYVANGTAIVAVDGTTHAFRYVVPGLSYPASLAYNPVSHHLYATQGDGVVDLDPTTRETRRLGYDFASPVGVAYDSTRNRIYAANLETGSVTIIDAATNRIAGRLDGFGRPDSVTYDPLADELFVGNEANYSLMIVDLGANRTVGMVPDVHPWRVLFDNRSGNLFVGTNTSLLAISGRTNAVVGNYTAHGLLEPLALDPVHGRVFTGSWVSSRLYVLDTTNLSELWTIPTAQLAIGSLGYDPVHGKLYTGQTGTGVVALDPSDGRVLATIPGPFRPGAPLFDPENGYVYVPDQGPTNDVWVIDPATDQVVQTIGVPDAPNDLTYNAANHLVYVAVGMLSSRSGLVVAVPSLRYPTPLPPNVFWTAVVAGIVAALVAAFVLLRRHRRLTGRKTDHRAGGTPPPSTPATHALAPGPPPRSPREVTVLVAMAAASILVVAALFGPWFMVLTRSTYAGNLATDDRGYGLSGYSARDITSGATATVGGNYVAWATLGSATLVVLVVTASALVAGLASLVLLDRSRRKGAPNRRIPMLLGFAAGALSYAAVVLFAATFPGAAHADGLLGFVTGFAGSTSSSSGGVALTWTWGPGWAWYGLLVAGGVFIAAPLVHVRRPATAPARETGSTPEPLHPPPE